MLSQFEVKNYKCIEHIDIPLTPIHVIVGQNDSGKTSLLEAILALHQIVSMLAVYQKEQNLADGFPGMWERDELVRVGSQLPLIEFSVNVIDHTVSERQELRYQLAVEFDLRGRVCYWDRESCAVENARDALNGPQKPSKVTFERPDNSLLIRDDHRALFQRVVDLIGTARLYHLDPSTMAIPASMEPHRTFRLDPDGFGLSTLLDDILGYDPNTFLQISAEFCRYFPQFTKVRLETTKATERTYESSGLHRTGQANGKGIFLEMPGGSIRAQQASDGAILFLGILALMYSPKPPSVLLLEEPEKGVYPKRLRDIVELLRRLVDDSTRKVPQIILSTHSPYLLSDFSPEEVTLLRRKDGIGPVEAFPLRNASHIHERLSEDGFYLGELWYNLTEEELLGHV